MKYNYRVARFILLSGLVFTISVSFGVGRHANDWVVQTKAGLVSGATNADGDVYIFKGIPFAAPPVGKLRWTAPQAVRPWRGIRKCIVFGASEMQRDPVPFDMYSSEFLIPPKPISEDCLYLNVWTNSSMGSADKRPVIVWIHGGGFNSGAGSCPIYDGENMAKKGIVFVTVNYRFGIFGFLAHPELSHESRGQASGNYAFLDQIAALKWVQANISAFGGDPDRVTIAGQSAGASSVNILMASPLAKGLFQRVIAESGGMFIPDQGSLRLKAAELSGEKLLQVLQVSHIDELRAMPADQLFTAASFFKTPPVIDGYVLPDDLYSMFENDRQNDVPVLTGWNSGEGFPGRNAPAPEIYRSNAVKQYGESAGDFLNVFPGTTDAEVKQSQFAWARDIAFAWQNYTWAKLETEKGKHAAYLYIFKRTPPGDEQFGTFHAAEISYALQTLQMRNRPWTDADRRLAGTMSSYWANFAAIGDPNGKGLPEWKPFDPSGNGIMGLDSSDVSMQTISARPEFDFLDRYEAGLRKPR
jgi:para-nitrobenzyl esterase